MRAMVEDDLREEDGLEPVARRPLLERIDALLRSNEQQVEVMEQSLDQELWQHAWYAFTEEWAWFRAYRDIMSELGEKVIATPVPVVDELIHQRYHEKFNDYVEEVAMDSDHGDRDVQKKLSSK